MTLLPSQATYRPGDQVIVEFDAPVPSDTHAVVTHLAEVVATVSVPAGSREIDLGIFAHGGYGVTIDALATAFDVLDSRWERPRYGFVVKLTSDADVEAVTRFFRRMHLSAAQLYDWAYRHSQLLPPHREYLDPLGQPRDLDVVNAMSSALSRAGVTPMGYAAVYAIGHDEVRDWSESVLLRASGEPYRLGEEFLILVDPAEPRWLAHLAEQLAAVVDGTAIEGFHLDQYGWPKFAMRGDGARVDLAESFTTMIGAVRDRLPHAPFMFNNVNDFPTYATAPLAQDATYIEVWEPHSTLGDLGALASAARAARPDHPPILSAYLHCYESAPEAACTEAAKLVMASALSHGATHLLLGEAGNALTDPYYPNNHELGSASLDEFAAWCDFQVRYGDLLFDERLAEVTEFFAGGINEDVVLRAAGVECSTKAMPGTLWLRVARLPHGVAVHLINLVAQDEIAWDSPKREAAEVRDATLSISFVEPGSEVWAASPEHPDLRRLEHVGTTSAEQANSLSAGQSGVTFALPPLGHWTVVWIPSASIGV